MSNLGGVCVEGRRGRGSVAIGDPINRFDG